MTTTKLFALLCGALLLSLASCGTKKPHTPEPTPPSQVPIVITPSTEEPRWVRPAGDSIREEMRAVWLTTVYGLDWPRDRADTPDGVRRQKESLLRILDRLKSATSVKLPSTALLSAIVARFVFEHEKDIKNAIFGESLL